MRFFATKNNFEDTNEEVIRILLNSQKSQEKELEELEKLKYENSVKEKFNTYFQNEKFYELFKYMIEFTNDLSDGFISNIYLLILFYIDKCSQNSEKENLRTKVLKLAEENIEQKNLLLKIMGMYFNGLEEKNNKLEVFKKMFVISKSERIYFLYDYFKNPERIFDLSDFKNENLFDMYSFVLERNKDRKNLDDFSLIFEKLLKISENLKLDQKQENYIEQNLTYVLSEPSLIFNLDFFEKYQRVKDVLKKNEISKKITDLKNPDKIPEKADQVFNYNKLINLALKKKTYTIDELTKLFFKESNSTNNRKLQRLVISAGRLNLLNVQIDQKLNCIHFVNIKQTFFVKEEKIDLIRSLEQNEN